MGFLDKIRLKAMAFSLALLVSAFAVGCADINAQKGENIGKSNDKEHILSGKSTSKPIKVGESNKSNPKSAKVPTFESIRKYVKSAESTQKIIKKTAMPKQFAQKNANQKNITKVLNKTQQIQAKNTQNLEQIHATNAQDSKQDSQMIQAQNPKDSSDLIVSLNAAPKAHISFNPVKLNQSLPQLESRCASGDLGHCEDLGRIYAVQEKRDLAVAHYKRACNNGKGKVMSCFFLSLIYANNGDSATSSEYLSVISDKLESHKIDEAELLLSIGEIALIKEKLQNFCANGESSSCKILSSVFKIRSENSEARAFFSAGCKRTNNPNAMLCVILKSLQ